MVNFILTGVLAKNSDADGKQGFAIHWEPPPEYAYKWKNAKPNVPKALKIYECHVGISGSEPKVSSFNYFIEKVSLLCFKYMYVHYENSKQLRF